MINVYFLGFVCSFLLVLLQIPFVIRLSIRFGCYDERDVHRKDHQQGISRLGGIALFLGFMSAMMLWYRLEDVHILFLIPGYLVMFALGLKDDLHGVAAIVKGIVQVVAALLILGLGAFDVGNLCGLFQLCQGWTFWIGLIAILLMLVISNSFNMIDGIDGLAGVIGLFVHLMLGLLLRMSGDEDHSFLSTIMAGAIAGFLYYNVNPAKIFMGDCGSMLIGLSAAVLSIIYLNRCLVDPGGAFSSKGPAIITALLIVPLFDLIRVFALRLFNRKSPFSGDRNHLHHELKRLGLSDNEAVFLLLAFNMTVFLFTLFLNQFGYIFMMLCQLIMCLVFHVLLNFLKSFK